MPVLTSRTASSVSLASRCSTMRSHRPVGEADDASVAAGVVEHHGEHGGRSVGRLVLLDRERPERRPSPAGCHRAPRACPRWGSALPPPGERVPCPAARSAARRRTRGADGHHLLVAVPQHDHGALRGDGLDGRQHMQEHGPAAHAMQHLGQLRLHALALARGQHDDAADGRTHPVPTLRYRRRIEKGSWGGRIRTYASRDQNPLPYRLATPHRFRLAGDMPGSPGSIGQSSKGRQERPEKPCHLLGSTPSASFLLDGTASPGCGFGRASRLPRPSYPQGRRRARRLGAAGDRVGQAAEDDGVQGV